MTDDKKTRDRFYEACALVIRYGRVSPGMVKRIMGVRLDAAVKHIERMEEIGIVSAPDEDGVRHVANPENVRAVVDAIKRESEQDGIVKQWFQAAGEVGGNDPLDSYNVTADELRQFIERFEQLESEKKDIAEQQKELMAEAKGRGYDTKVMKKLIALRRRNSEDIAEEDAIMDMYKSALGMQ